MTRTPEPPDFPASQLFLRRLAFSLVHDEARAEDLVQDTWAAWAEHRPSGLAEPKAWLARVLRNRAFNQKRADERRSRREDESLHGRPDPSHPETDGTLEAQAQLLEALRKLDEPYRSTLVQRYYHDLAPKEIADRSGTPLNTVKARLARGLERLRGELDRRYGGDRSAWCHWLTVMGAPPVPVAVPHGTAGGAPGAPLFAGMGGGLSLLGLLGLSAALAVGAVLKSGWLSSRERRPANERQASVPESESVKAGDEVGRVPVATEKSRHDRPAQAPVPELPHAIVEASPALLGYGGAPTSVRGREDFDWPQYAGGADHANFRERKDEIRCPKVLWFSPGCAGQPTMRDGDLYTGGLALARLDPDSGVPTAMSFDLLSEALELDLSNPASGGTYRTRSPAIEKLLEQLLELGPNDAASHTVASAPVVTPELVIARCTRDGGVSAYDRGLMRRVWSWDVDVDADDPSSVPLCLASDEVVLVATRFHLIALSVSDGRQLWRFFCDGEIRMVPASDGERAFVGTERGDFYCLSLASGNSLWSSGASSGFGTSPPVVVGKRVLVADIGPARAGFGTTDEPELAIGPQNGRLLAFAAATGHLQWTAPVNGYRVSDLGLGRKQDYLVVGHGAELARFQLGSGKRDELHRVETNPHSYGTPTVVGDSVVFGDLDGVLSVHELDSGKLRWAFRASPGGQAGVPAFVHTGTRIYVATALGLFCLADDPERKLPPPGLELVWNGDPRAYSYVAEER